MNDSRRNFVAAFTLIELLVVVTVIGVLIAILVPSIARSVETAKGVKCMSNLGQLGKSLIAFSSNEGKFPVGIDTTAPGGRVWIWPPLLRQYLKMGDTSVDLFHCPMAPEEAQWKVAYGSGIPAQDGYYDDEIRLRHNGKHFMSYGYNVWGHGMQVDWRLRGLGYTRGIAGGERRVLTWFGIRRE